MSVRQYNRKLSFLVGGSPSTVVTQTAQGTTTTFNQENEAIDLSAFRVRFTIRRGDIQTPNSADVRVFNLSDRTAKRLTSSEFSRIVIQAGYEGNFGLLFDGQIKQARTGRIDAKDSYVDIVAADGDEFYNFAPMAVSLSAGAEPLDAVQAFVKTMPGSVGLGYVPELSKNGSLRGRVYYGMTRDELRDFAEANDLLWSIQDGKLTFIPQTAYIPGSTPLISPATGLVGVPEQTQNGIQMRVLINPAIRIGQLVKLDSTVNPFRYGLDVQSQASNLALARSNKTNADGLYYVMRADHTGDTRGEEWYTDLTCLAVDATVPRDAASQGAILPEAASIRRY